MNDKEMREFIEEARLNERRSLRRLIGIICFICFVGFIAYLGSLFVPFLF